MTSNTILGINFIKGNGKEYWHRKSQDQITSVEEQSITQSIQKFYRLESLPKMAQPYPFTCPHSFKNIVILKSD
jgi:hypothetical protein